MTSPNRHRRTKSLPDTAGTRTQPLTMERRISMPALRKTKRTSIEALQSVQKVTPEPLPAAERLRSKPVADHIRDDVDASIAEYMIEDGWFSRPPAGELANFMGRVKELYRRYVGNPSAEVITGGNENPYILPILGKMTKGWKDLGRLQKTVGDGTFTIPLPQAEAVNNFLDQYPHFWPNLRACIKRVNLNSKNANGFGGSAFDIHGDKTIHVARLHTTSPDAYVRLFAHETGHATFERILLGNKTIDPPLNKGEVRDRPTSPENEDRDEFDELFASLGPEDKSVIEFRDELPADAKEFYAAWETLRSDDGRHLLGLDLGLSVRGEHMSPAERQKYQAGRFSEFCAETFMQYAKGDLLAHIAGVGDATAKDAWNSAYRVLDKHAKRILTQDISKELANLKMIYKPKHYYRASCVRVTLLSTSPF